MNQELIYQASFLEKQSQELQEKVNFISQQISELEVFSKNLLYLDSSNNDEMLSSLGKGVLVKTKLLEKKLFVEVGSGILVRKTPKEAQEVIENQIKIFTEAKDNLESQLESINTHLQSLMERLQAQE